MGLDKLKFAYYSIVMLILWRCKKENNDSKPEASTEEKPPEQKESQVKESVLPTQPLEVLGTGPSETSCKDSSRIPVEKIPAGGEEFEVIYKVFGASPSAIVAMTIPLYQHRKNPLSAFYLCNENGLVLAQRQFLDINDLKPNKTMRTVIFEHVSLESTKSLVFVMVLRSQKTVIYRDNKIIDFYEEFEKLPVRSERADPQNKTQLFMYPNDVDYLVDAETSSMMPYTEKQIEFTDDLRKSVITTLTGEILSAEGEGFKNFEEHPLVASYKKVNNSHYTRTILRII